MQNSNDSTNTKIPHYHIHKLKILYLVGNYVSGNWVMRGLFFLFIFAYLRKIRGYDPGRRSTALKKNQSINGYHDELA